MAQIRIPESNPEKAPKKALDIVVRALEEGKSSLLEYEAEQVAKQYKIPVAKGGLATTERQATVLAKGLGFPLVMKIVSPDILHKSDVGGVKIGIDSLAEVRKAFGEILRNVKKAKKGAEVKGVYVQKMAPKSPEFVVGGVRDPQFGPTVMFGLGGIYVELFKDVVFRLAPLTQSEAIEMINEIKSAPLLTGFRGSKPLDIKAAANAIMAVGEMMTDIDKIESVDINPLFVYPKGAMAADVRIVLAKPKEEVAVVAKPISEEKPK